jgi:polyribonucleotide nucleotidyltransferase
MIHTQFPKNKNASLPSFSNGMSKKKILELADASVSICLEEGNVLQVAEAISAMAEFVEQVRKDERFIQAVIDEANKNAGKLETSSGAKIEVCETGVTYNYSSNPEWVELKNREKEITDRRKAIEEILKKIQPGKLLVDPESGQTLTGPTKTSKTNYKLTLSK